MSQADVANFWAEPGTWHRASSVGAAGQDVRSRSQRMMRLADILFRVLCMGCSESEDSEFVELDVGLLQAFLVRLGRIMNLGEVRYIV